MKKDRTKDVIRDKKRADIKRIIINNYKLRIGCKDCGYKENAWALEFDHKDGEDKRNTVASLMYGSWENILKEIKKCEVVCANCHAIRTFKRKFKGRLSQLVEETVLETAQSEFESLVAYLDKINA